MRKFFIYKITNKINGKIYVGKTYSIKIRWRCHKLAAKKKRAKDYSYIHKAMNKYGFDNFEITQLAEYNSEKSALLAEVNFIAQFNSTDSRIGYNLSKGGDGATGSKHSLEVRQRLANLRKIKYLGKGNPFYGKKHSKKFKSKQSKIMRKFCKTLIHYNNNLNQCALTTEQCLEVQILWRDNNILMKEIAKQYSVHTSTISLIINGSYFAIKGKSLLTNEIIQKIKSTRLIISGQKHRKFSQEQEKNIRELYKSGILIKNLSKEFDCSKPTISKIINR